MPATRFMLLVVAVVALVGCRQAPEQSAPQLLSIPAPKVLPIQQSPGVTPPPQSMPGSLPQPVETDVPSANQVDHFVHFLLNLELQRGLYAKETIDRFNPSRTTYKIRRPSMFVEPQPTTGNAVEDAKNEYRAHLNWYTTHVEDMAKSVTQEPCPPPCQPLKNAYLSFLSESSGANVQQAAQTVNSEAARLRQQYPHVFPFMVD